jgi:serine/threonine protein phosphatase 1
MISKLFARQPRQVPAPPPRPPAAVPAGMRVYAIGDIHGRRDLLAALHERILADAAAQPATRHVVVYLGDYCDRGLETREVIDLLLDAPLPGFEAVHLKGNHEDFMLRFLEDTRVGPGWFANGGGGTLYSYGVRTLPRGSDVERLQSLQRQFNENLPERHLRFLESLARWHVEGDYLFVHAGIRPGVPLERQMDEDILWIRELFLEDESDHGHFVVHGHTITEQPDMRPNRIGIDTGAFATGVLTCLVLEGTERRFLQTSS